MEAWNIYWQAKQAWTHLWPWTYRERYGEEDGPGDPISQNHPLIGRYEDIGESGRAFQTCKFSLKRGWTTLTGLKNIFVNSAFFGCGQCFGLWWSLLLSSEKCLGPFLVVKEIAKLEWKDSLTQLRRKEILYVYPTVIVSIKLGSI